VLWTVVIGILALPVLALPRRINMRFGRFWARSVLVLLGVVVGLDHEVRGRDRLPRGGYILALKHQSAWDALIVPIVLGDPAVIVKRELLWLPIYGWYASRAGSIGIDRKGGAGALRRMVAAARPVAGDARRARRASALSAGRCRALSGAWRAAGAGRGQFRPFLGAAQLPEAQGTYRPRISRPDRAGLAAQGADGRDRTAYRKRHRGTGPRGRNRGGDAGTRQARLIETGGAQTVSAAAETARSRRL
jgi:1-acyl-sn-glycerol-3-phosphate acyltransferase